LPAEGESLAPGPSSLLEAVELDSSIQQRGETLDQVLRSVAVVRQAGANSTARVDPRRSNSADADNSDDNWLGMREMVLNSTFAGAALRSVLEAHADGDAPAGFSVFGFGSFVLEATVGGSSLELTDASNGWSVVLAGERGASGHGDSARETVPGSDVKKVAVVRWLLTLVENFVTSPLGIVLEAIAVLVLTFWMVIQGIAMARQSQPSTARLAPRPGARKPAAARRARHRTRRRRRRRVRSSIA